MSALAVCLNKKKHKISKEIFLPMHDAQRLYGIDINNSVLSESIGFSYQGFWTTPEEKGEQQPITLFDKFLILWDGRIDNRAEVYTTINNPSKPLNELSDAELYLLYFLENIADPITGVIGSYAWVVYNQETNELWAGRDPMGARYLVYAEDEEWLCIASTVSAISAHPSFKFNLNQRLVAQSFAYITAVEGATFNQNVNQLLPGNSLHYSGLNRISIKNCYLPDPSSRIQYADKSQYIEQFRELFENSVQSRLRSITPISSMVSGGLDSLPITLIARQLITAEQELYGVMWAFDKLKECDERSYVKDIFNKKNIQLVPVNCDSAYPFNPDDNWVMNPDNPFDTPYRGKHQRAYKMIQQKGCRVTLSGMAGDDLYMGTELIFWELAKAGKIIDAINELKYRAKYKSTLVDFLKRHLFWYTSAWYKLSSPKVLTPDYLTDNGCKLIAGYENRILANIQEALRPRQYEQLLGGYWSTPLSNEKFFSNQYEIETRYPLRDRRIVEFMLQIPSEYLYFNGVHRPILRDAFASLLPEKVRLRKDKTSFVSVLLANSSDWNQGELDKLKARQSENYVKFSLNNENSVKSLRNLMIILSSLYFDRWCSSYHH